MAGNRISVGNVEALSVTDGFSAKRDPTATFPETSIEQWREYPEIVDENDEIQSRYGSVILRSEGKIILVDTGMQTATGGALLDDMRGNGVAPEDVDIVFLTHLHPDHVGWNIDLSSGKPAFPNARYIAPRSDYDYWIQPDVLAAAEHVQLHVVPLTELKLLDLFDEGYKVTDELITVSTPGHTPGHTSLLIASGGERAFVLGDVAHSPAQAHYTDWNPMFDIQPDISRPHAPPCARHARIRGNAGVRGALPGPGVRAFRPTGGQAHLAGHLAQHTGR